jgi:hypothetical protein
MAINVSKCKNKVQKKNALNKGRMKSLLILISFKDVVGRQCHMTWINDYDWYEIRTGKN